MFTSNIKIDEKDPKLIFNLKHFVPITVNCPKFYLHPKLHDMTRVINELCIAGSLVISTDLSYPVMHTIEQ